MIDAAGRDADRLGTSHYSWIFIGVCKLTNKDVGQSTGKGTCIESGEFFGASENLIDELVV